MLVDEMNVFSVDSVWLRISIVLVTTTDTEDCKLSLLTLERTVD